jgi:hypothetical protein
MGDKIAIRFLTTLLKSSHQSGLNPLEQLNLSRNNLGFKTGAHLMNMLVEPRVKETTRLRNVELGYNTISVLLQNSINKLLSETDYALNNGNE